MATIDGCGQYEPNKPNQMIPEEPRKKIMILIRKQVRHNELQLVSHQRSNERVERDEQKLGYVSPFFESTVRIHETIRRK